MENNIWFNVGAIVFSGIFGVILTIIVQRKLRLYDLRYDVLIDFVENRYDLKGIEFTKAINKIYLIYGKKKRVIIVLRDFHKAIIDRSTIGEETNKKLRNVYIEMCKAVHIDPMDEELFYKPFNIKY